MKTIALISSLDTKEEEILYAKELIEKRGLFTFLIDLSTRRLENAHADLKAKEILGAAGIGEEQIRAMDKADCISAMENAAKTAVQTAYADGRFQGILCIGGGQNARMAAEVMRELPLGVPKMIVSPLISGKRTIEQFMGASDIILRHSVVDFSGLNSISRKVIYQCVQAVVGMVVHPYSREDAGGVKIGMTMLGVTTRFADGIVKGMGEEGVCFHANGTGGRCYEEMIRQGVFDVSLDANLHELTCEMLGGFCEGAPGRLRAAADSGIPILCVPGAVDVIDYYFEDGVTERPERFLERKHVFHNANICHTKAFPEEMRQLGEETAKRLNRAKGKVTVVLPDDGFCEAGRKGQALCDPAADQAFTEALKSKLDKNIRVLEVEGNINDDACIGLCIREVQKLIEKR